MGPGKRALDGVHIGATWQIRLNCPCAAANYSDHLLLLLSIGPSVNQSINWNHTSAKANLTSAAIRIQIRDPDRHQNLIISSMAHLLPTFRENFMQIS